MFEITTSLIFFLVSTFYGSPTDMQSFDYAEGKETTKVNYSEIVDNPITIEEYVKEYYKDVPILAEISKCESEFKHLGKNGQVIRGIVNDKDIGVMQINEEHHMKQAKALGYDIYTLKGNMAYAKWLYEKEGTRPWLSSLECWKKNGEIIKA